jgi:hypothetical protein
MTANLEDTQHVIGAPRRDSQPLQLAANHPIELPCCLEQAAFSPVLRQALLLQSVK